MAQSNPSAMSYPNASPLGHSKPNAVAQPNPSAMSYPNASPLGHSKPNVMAQPNPSAMSYPNPSPLGHPNQSAMAQPNTSAMVYPNLSNMAYPNQNAMAYPNQNAMAMAYPNPSNMAYPNQSTMTYLNQNAMAQPNPVYPNQSHRMPYANASAPLDSKYAMVYSEGTTKYSSAPDSDTPIMRNEPPKPNDETMDFEVPGFDFSKQFIRKMFIRKVYAVLMSQLLLTVAITAFFMYCQPVREFMLQPKNVAPVWISLGVLAMVLMYMLLCTELRRVAPWNFIFLAIFTVTQGVTVGILAIYSGSDVVLLACGVTAGVVLALTLFAFQTKWDFTTIGGGLLATLVVLILFGSIAAFVPSYRTMNLLYCNIGVILFSFYIIYNTQLMIDGEHRYSVSPEEYIFAAITLHLDILKLFLNILPILIIAVCCRRNLKKKTVDFMCGPDDE